MEIALEEARIAAGEGEIPVGAVVVCDGNIIARAHNRRHASGNPLDHAEIIALRDAAEALGGWRLEGCSVYVTLEPCPMCAGALVQARVANLIFGARDMRLGAAGSKYNLVSDETTHHRLKVTDCIMEQECGDMLREFFRKRRA
ncbi:MAG: tRNA-specific adenosine deaminase [Actinobacteria bacterium RBG_19FT_COMBO_54_7]|uniref:tRNA-specific adenosine deaminase n=1 Tax=Candidatus Solincola sediminis TaxID=1797199 RepID=A0A1F2WN96_9ACTN|nr:MAG: tRNA-specific adenosine deaminase [Candidatus Solincola sediminis]OFW60277.1 MAG: tRNA-specific adenosine deaminase [Candidatus Solincola sediminis]OFW65185.1 MAG: tRNA-specific adenosine deaminase [Actinobacteria bacterium RBG_19FT_COMBO_54_7]